jgi:hypothetical protein
MMSETIELCKELKSIQAVIGIAGNPPLRSEPLTTRQFARIAEDILRHIQAADQTRSRTQLRPRLDGETVYLLASIKRHVGDIVRCTDAGPWSRNAAGSVVATDEALLEHFADLRDKCCYPLMDVLERISAIVEAEPVPADAMTAERAVQLFCVTRDTLRQAVHEGELKSYRDPYEPGSSRRYSEAQLAGLYDHRA